MSEQERTPEEAEQELVNAWVAWKEDTEIGVADPSIARALIASAATSEPLPVTPTPGAFFEVTGAEHELFRIAEGINRNEGRETSDSSMTLDLWQGMLEEWHARRDAKVRAWERAKHREEMDRADQVGGDLIRQLHEHERARHDAEQALTEERAKRPDRDQVKEVADALETLAEMVADGLSVNDLYAHLHKHQATLLSSIALEHGTREVTDATVRRAHRGWLEAESGRTLEDWEFESLRSDAQARLIRAALEASAQS